MPPSLEELILDGGDPLMGQQPHKFMGGIPSEWGLLTNLKKLSMQYCGLKGAAHPSYRHRSQFGSQFRSQFRGPTAP